MTNERRSLNHQEEVRRKLFRDGWDDARIRDGWTQKKLGKLIGKSQSAITAWLMGTRPLGEQQFNEIMGHIKPRQAPRGVAAAAATGVPVLDISLVKPFLEDPTRLPAERLAVWHRTGASLSHRAFAVVVQGSALANSDHPLCALDGDIVVFDNLVQPEHGHLVCVQDRNETVIRQLLIEGSRSYASPLSSRFSVTELSDQATVLGVARRIERDLTT